MPEGPDIALIVEDMERIYTGSVVSFVRYSKEEYKWIEELIGLKFASCTHHGKIIYMKLEDETGDMIYVRINLIYTGRLYNKYVQDKGHYFTLLFDNNQELSLYDHINNAQCEYVTEQINTGICIMKREINVEDIIEWKKSKRMIVHLMLEQDVLCGIGTQLADEILYVSDIHPATLGNNLTNEQFSKLAQSIHEVASWVSICGGFWHSHPILLDGSNGYYTPKYKIVTETTPRLIKFAGKQFHVVVPDPEGYKPPKTSWVQEDNA